MTKNPHAINAADEAVSAILVARQVISMASTALVRKDDDDEQGAFFSNELGKTYRALTIAASRIKDLGRARSEEYPLW